MFKCGASCATIFSLTKLIISVLIFHAPFSAGNLNELFFDLEWREFSLLCNALQASSLSDDSKNVDLGKIFYTIEKTFKLPTIQIDGS